MWWPVQIHDFAGNLEFSRAAYRETHKKSLAAVGVLLYVLALVELCGNHRIARTCPTNCPERRQDTANVMMFHSGLVPDRDQPTRIDLCRS